MGVTTCGATCGAFEQTNKFDSTRTDSIDPARTDRNQQRQFVPSLMRCIVACLIACFPSFVVGPSDPGGAGGHSPNSMPLHSLFPSPPFCACPSLSQPTTPMAHFLLNNPRQTDLTMHACTKPHTCLPPPACCCFCSASCLKSVFQCRNLGGSFAFPLFWGPSPDYMYGVDLYVEGSGTVLYRRKGHWVASESQKDPSRPTAKPLSDP